jgi:predicted O-methyltransferase YrrM
LDVGPYIGKLDLVFIDADHTYDAVINDSHKALQMLSPKGIVVWHDYTVVIDTKRACHAFMQRNPNRRFVHILDTTLLVMLAEA